MVDWLDWDNLNSLVEYGPGTGAITEIIQQRLQADTSFFAIERDPELAAHTRQRCPEVTVHEDCVSRVSDLCSQAGIEQVDAVLCGLPWASFSPEMQDICLKAMFEILPPGGRFATFAYWQGLMLPAGQRFRRYLKENFTTVTQSKTSWKNLPPAFVYQCVR